MRIIFILLVTCSSLFSQNLYFNPNPFNGRGLISFTLASNDTVTLQVLSSTGQIAVTLYSNTPLLAGIYTDSLIMPSHPDGVYFLSFKTKKGFTQNLKLVKTIDTGIEGDSQQLGVSVYPNPVNKALTIQNPFPDEIFISLYNSFGQIVVSLRLSEAKGFLDVTSLTAGVYYLVAESGGRRYFNKIVKQD